MYSSTKIERTEDREARLCDTSLRSRVASKGDRIQCEETGGMNDFWGYKLGL